MSELRLEPWRKRPYGVFAHGIAEHNGHEVPIRVRSPHENIHDEDLPKILNLNGWTTGHESMAVTARTTVRLGHLAVTFDYTNRGGKNPLERNADDGLTVLKCMPEGPLTVTGLSMGGAVGTKVANKTDRPVMRLNLVSPGGYTKGIDGMTKLAMGGALVRESLDDLGLLLASPASAIMVARDGLKNCLRRPIGVAAELDALLHDTVYGDLRQFRQDQLEATVLLAHASNDKLIRRQPLLDSIGEEESDAPGSLIDINLPYRGSHMRLAVDPQLTEDIMRAEFDSTASLERQGNYVPA